MLRFIHHLKKGIAIALILSSAVLMLVGDIYHVSRIDAFLSIILSTLELFNRGKYDEHDQ